jgi:trehalose-6-phosphate synthase
LSLFIAQVGFFLHIPFQPPANFFEKYNTVALACLRGILRFTKAGFQTHLDRQTFVLLVEKHLGRAAKITYDKAIDTFMIRNEGWSCALGVFPVSIKNEEFLACVNDEKVQSLVKTIKEDVSQRRK